MTDTEPRGLYPKFLVFENNGKSVQSPVPECFVLCPSKDSAAYEALWQYAESTDNEELAQDLRGWLYRIAREKREEAKSERDELAAENADLIDAYEALKAVTNLIDEVKQLGSDLQSLKNDIARIEDRLQRESGAKIGS